MPRRPASAGWRWAGESERTDQGGNSIPAPVTLRSLLVAWHTVSPLC